jgi:hypothetical protein
MATAFGGPLNIADSLSINTEHPPPPALGGRSALVFDRNITYASFCTMQQLQFTDAELRQATERCLKYQGTAKVSLNQIHFNPKWSSELDDQT